jgi:hypothetical protein
MAGGFSFIELTGQVATRCRCGHERRIDLG